MITRLKDLREDNELTQLECAKIAYISKNTYIRYENGERKPTPDVLVLFSEYYKTSVDYILKLTDEIKPYPRKKITTNCEKEIMKNDNTEKDNKLYIMYQKFKLLIYNEPLRMCLEVTQGRRHIGDVARSEDISPP